MVSQRLLSVNYCRDESQRSNHRESRAAPNHQNNARSGYALLKYNTNEVLKQESSIYLKMEKQQDQSMSRPNHQSSNFSINSIKRPKISAGGSQIESDESRKKTSETH